VLLGIVGTDRTTGLTSFQFNALILRADLLTARIREWLSWINGNNISESHKSQVFNLLSAVLSRSGGREKRIRTNPRKGRGVKKPVPDKRDITPWAEGRLRKIQLALPLGNHRASPWRRPGLRQGEILGLSPDDIDREQMIVHIDRQLAYVGNRPLFKLPKGRKTRTVPISRGLLNLIDDTSSHIRR
jgi:integrase